MQCAERNGKESFASCQDENCKRDGGTWLWKTVMKN